MARAPTGSFLTGRGASGQGIGEQAFEGGGGLRLVKTTQAVEHLLDPHLLRIGRLRHGVHEPARAKPLQLREAVSRLDAVEVRTGGRAAVLRKGVLHAANLRRSMEPFLHHIARLLLEDHGHDLARVAVVLPSQRAGIHLRKHLATLAGGPLWSPQLMTANGLAERVSGLRVTAGIELLFEAFAVHRTLEGRHDTTFDEFLQWAPIALRDISEADAHLVPLEGFYRDLRNWEELDWSFNDLPLSRGQERMVHYWAMQGELHRRLNERLRSSGRGTAGLVEREAAALAGETAVRTGWTKVWAVGLNALDPAQRATFSSLRQQGLLEVAWDADVHYLDDPGQEAGASLRAAIGALGHGRVAPINGLRDKPRTITVITVPNTIAQVHVAAAELATTPPEQLDRTAVVLADEQLLMPLLDALPPGIGGVNVTMGLPLHALPVSGLIDALLDLHRGHRPGRGHRTADVDRLLRHPMLARGPALPHLLRALDAVRDTRRAHMPGTDVIKCLHESGEVMLARAEQVLGAPATTGAELADRLLGTIAWASEASTGDRLAQEQLFLTARIVQRTKALCTLHGIAPDATTFAGILQRLIREERIGLFGEPLSGVQVMGMLETRALDLDRVIMLSVEEGVVPPPQGDRSFIPFELRRAHGLPLRSEHEAVSAYHFHRALQRTGTVTLTRSSGEGSQGVSRFVLQLEHEQEVRKGTQLVARTLQAPVPARRAHPLVVMKDERVLEQLHQWLERGLSPSALSSWLSCPLDLYFGNILRLRDTEEAREMIAPDLLGTALHEAIEAVYRPFLGQLLMPGMLDEAARSAPEELAQRLHASVGGEALRSGQPLLQHGMARQAMLAYIRAERGRLADGERIELVVLEEPFRVPLEGARDQFGVDVHLTGRIDRVERRNDLPVILDIKTGKVNEQDLKLKDLDPANLRPEKHGYALQLLMYAYAHLLQHPGVDHVKAGLVPLQRASASGGLFLQVADEPLLDRSMLPAMAGLLRACVAGMLDPAVPFTHRPESRYCGFCAG